SGGDPDRQHPALPGVGIGDRDLPWTPLDRLLDPQGDRRLRVAAGLGDVPEPSRSAEARRAASPPAPRTVGAEKHLEKVAEPRAAGALEIPEVEAAAPLAEPLIARRRAARPVPVGTELVVLPALVRILQDLVGLADLLELDLGLRVLVDVGMELARHLPVCLLDVLLGRVLLDSQ